MMILDQPLTDSQRRRKESIATSKQDRGGVCRTDGVPGHWDCRCHRRSILLCLNAGIQADTRKKQSIALALSQKLVALRAEREGR